MTNTIELENSFSEYALNELVKKLRELDPEDYENHGKELDATDLLELLLEDEQANECYYIYTADSEQVFKTYFNDILSICDSFGYADGEPIDLNASNLVLVAMEHAFAALLDNAFELHEIRFNDQDLKLLVNYFIDMDSLYSSELING